jgi:UDP-N-acetyl-D-mannosaminuronate dehydrogenase
MILKLGMESKEKDKKIMIEKVLVAGLGQLGLPVAKYVKQKGFETYGYDINPEAVERAFTNFGIQKIDSFEEIDVFILCVSTHEPNDMFTPQIEGLLSLAEKISLEAKSGALVSIESTISKGTSKRIFEMLNHRLHVAHAPHRWYALEEDVHGVNQLRVLGGVNDCCLRLALEFYDVRNKYLEKKEEHESSEKDLGIPMHPVSEIEIAELTKIIENANRYMQIAFAEDLYLYCQANNVNFAELKDALNTKWNVDILEPLDGIGGHCLPKDTKMFIQSSRSIRSKILLAAMEVDDDYRRYRQSRGVHTISQKLKNLQTS